MYFPGPASTAKERFRRYLVDIKSWTIKDYLTWAGTRKDTQLKLDLWAELMEEQERSLQAVYIFGPLID